jgi:hypothetical protein
MTTRQALQALQAFQDAEEEADVKEEGPLGGIRLRQAS